MYDWQDADVIVVADWLKQFPNLHVFPRVNKYADELETNFGVVSVFYI